MKFLPLLKTCIKALVRNPMRAALTILGIIIGIAAVIAMVEIGQGSTLQIKSTIASMGADTVSYTHLYCYYMTASTIPSIGIDFGGTSIKLGVVRGTEVIAHAPSIATQEYGNPDQLIEAIAQFVNMLRLNHPEVQAIGMGMPGRCV